MKPLNWLTDQASHAYMRMRQAQNLHACRDNRNENWLRDILQTQTHLKWNRQTIWGKRLFDFWNGHLGIAVETDGSEHRKDYDAYRDEYNFRRSGIIVLRLRNRNDDDAASVLAFIRNADPIAVRKEKLGIAGDTKAARRSLAKLPYPPSLLAQFIASH